MLVDVGQATVSRSLVHSIPRIYGLRQNVEWGLTKIKEAVECCSQLGVGGEEVGWWCYFVDLPGSRGWCGSAGGRHRLR
jgi:hypothetical protein